MNITQVAVHNCTRLYPIEWSLGPRLGHDVSKIQELKNMLEWPKVRIIHSEAIKNKVCVTRNLSCMLIIIIYITSFNLSSNVFLTVCPFHLSIVTGS